MTAEWLIGIAWKTTALLALAWMCARLMRRSSAAARHLVWMAALVAAVVLPVLPALVPAWQALPRTAIIVDAVAASGAMPGAPAGVTLVAVWMLGAGLTLAVFAIAHARTAWIAIRSREDDGLRVTQDAVSPFVWGVGQALIVWPAQAREWPEDLRRAALTHEREHARRGDFAWTIVAQAACAMYWFLPLAWFAARQAREESERACDDAVLREGASATGYAEQLLYVARTTMAAAAVPAMTGGSPMERRMRALLDRTANRAGLSRRTIAAAALACVAIALPLAALQQDDRVYKIGGGVERPRLVHKVEPAYTEEARDAKIAGTVTLSVIVERDGTTSGIQVVKSLDGGLDANAILAVQQWRFEPAKKDGKAVRVSAVIEVNFRLL